MKVISLKNKLDLSSVKNTGGEKNTDELPINNDVHNDTRYDIRHDMPDFSKLFHVPEVELSPEQTKEKRKAIIHIKNYLREFPLCLAEFKNVDFNSKNIIQLQNILEEIKLTVCQSNSGGLLVGVFQGGCDILESVAPMVNYNLTGLKYVACNNPNIINAVKEISLEYQNLNYIPPEKRLALLMFQMCYVLNSANKLNSAVDDKMSKAIPEGLEEKYAEL